MQIKLLSFDIDGTLILPNQNKKEFYNLWQSLDFNIDNPILCYNTGRLINETKTLIKNKVLPEPAFIIAGVGTSIFDFKQNETIKEF